MKDKNHSLKTKLTVIIPLYNQEKYIEQCVESVLAQDYTDLPIIIVNDGSNDDSLKICEKIAFSKPQIKIISQENCGLVGARLTGIKAADTEYVTFVDADDFIEESAYKEAMKYVDEGVDQIFYEISRYYANGEKKREYHIVNPGLYDEKRISNEIFPKLIWDFKRNVPGIECSQCVRIVKRKMLMEAYDKLQGRNFYYGEDAAITFPMLMETKSLAVISQSYYMHRQRVGNKAPRYIISAGYFDEVFNLYGYLRNRLNEYARYDFNKQIDYMYIYSMELKKLAYDDYECHREFLFPFDKVEKNKNVILYGAGLVGKEYHKQLNKLQYCNRLVWVDKNALENDESLVKPIALLNDAEYKLFDFVVIAIENALVIKEVKNYLVSIGYCTDKIIF